MPMFIFYKYILSSTILIDDTVYNNVSFVRIHVDYLHLL